MAILATFRSKNSHIGHLRGSITLTLVYINQGIQIFEFNMSYVIFMSISLFEFLKWPLLGQKLGIWPHGLVGKFLGYFGHIRVVSSEKNWPPNLSITSNLVIFIFRYA